MVGRRRAAFHYGQRRRRENVLAVKRLRPTWSGGGQLLARSIMANGVGRRQAVRGGSAVPLWPTASGGVGGGSDGSESHAARWLAVAGGSETSLRPAGGPERGFPRPQKPTTPQRKSKGRRERGGGVRAPPKTSHTPPKELGAMWRPPFGADEPNDQAGNATTRRAAPNQIRAEQTPRAERPRPEHHDKQEPAPHNEQTKRPRRGGAPPGPDQHKPAYRPKRACPNAPPPASYTHFRAHET